MGIRRSVAAGVGALALGVGLLSALGTAGASAVTHRPASGEVSGLAGWGSAANKTITNRIFADQKSLAAKGIALTEWGPDQASGKVKIYLTHYSDAARRVLAAEYGKDIVVSRHSTPRPLLFGPAASSAPDASGGRESDSAPFAGGDRITTPLGGCTSGPTVYGNVSGSPYMLTAGHCATVGSTIKTHGVTMGTVTNVRMCNACIDSETVSGNYNPEVWGGGVTGNSLYLETGALFAQPGQGASSVVTNDGAYSGEVRGITVEAVNQNETFQEEGGGSITFRYLTKAAKPGVAACAPGDSGGPWIQHEGGTNNVLVVGTMEGGPADGSYCLYEQIDAITSWFNVHVP